MAHLHEVLAVESELEKIYKKVVQETDHTFKSKPDHFMSFIKTYQPFDENDQDVLAPEHKEIVTTVNRKLKYMFDHVVNYIDAVFQKEATNQKAKADIVIDDRVIAKDVPATMLLGLESKIVMWRNVLDNIPTLAPGVKWERDETEANDIWKTAHPIERRRTKKTIQHKIVVQATDKHPAQVEKWHDDVPIGKFIETHKSGMLSPAEKSELLGRVDTLLQAVKQARQRANTQEVDTRKIGGNIIDFIING